MTLLLELGASFGLYLLFAAKLSPHELLIGVVVAALAAAATHTVLRERPARFRARLLWIAEARRLPRDVLTGTWQILVVLARHLFTARKAPSLLLEAPFEADGDAAGATRRALATAYTTITPNFVVLGFDRGRRRMIFHQVARSPVPEMTARLGAAR